MKQRRIVLSDCHIPFQDKPVVRKWLDTVESMKPDGIDIIGDLIDAYSISRFDKNPARKANLQEELDEASVFLKSLKQVAPRGCDIRYTEGNHEDRLRKILWGKAKELAPLRNLSIPILLDLKSLGIRYHNAENPYKIGDLWYVHGDVIKPDAGLSAKAVAERIGGSVLMGHSHRMGYCPTTKWSGIQHAYECGYVADFRQLDYINVSAPWQQGWAIVDFGRGWHDVSFVRVHRRPNRHGTAYIWRGTEL